MIAIRDIQHLQVVRLESILRDVKKHRGDSIFSKFIWITRDGNKIFYKNLKDSHIENIIKSFRYTYIPIDVYEDLDTNRLYVKQRKRNYSEL